MATKSLRTFVLVMSVSPYHNGNFGRAGLRFSREWRPLEVVDDDKQDLEQGLINEETLERLKAEAFLAVKPATEAEIAKFEKDRATGARNPADEVAELRAANAQLEARLMKLEAGDKAAKGATK